MPSSTQVKNEPYLPFPQASFRQRVHLTPKVLARKLRRDPAQPSSSSHRAKNPQVSYGWVAFRENRSTPPKPDGAELLPFERMRKRGRLSQFHNRNRDDELKAYSLKPLSLERVQYSDKSFQSLSL